MKESTLELILVVALMTTVIISWLFVTGVIQPFAVKDYGNQTMEPTSEPTVAPCNGTCGIPDLGYGAANDIAWQQAKQSANYSRNRNSGVGGSPDIALAYPNPNLSKSRSQQEAQADAYGL